MTKKEIIELCMEKYSYAECVAEEASRFDFMGILGFIFIGLIIIWVLRVIYLSIKSF